MKVVFSEDAGDVLDLESFALCLPQGELGYLKPEGAGGDAQDLNQ